MPEDQLFQDYLDRGCFYLYRDGRYVMWGTKLECEAWIKNKNISPVQKKPRRRPRSNNSQLELRTK